MFMTFQKEINATYLDYEPNDFYRWDCPIDELLSCPDKAANRGEQRVSEFRVDPWLVLKTRSRHENIVEGVLQQKLIIAYLPKRKVIKLWRGRKRVVEIPLFPGYVFVRPRAEQYEGMRYIRGSCGLVLADSRPATMPEKDLDAVKMLVDSGAVITVDSDLIAGKRVKFDAGPFMGIEGELVLVKNQNLLVINVDMLNSSIRVEIDKDTISVL